MVPPRDLVTRVHERVGTTLMGKYRLDSVLGIGGMAAVYAATHRNTKRVAVKILHPELAQNSNVRVHFQREGYAANSVAHRGVVQVDDDDVTEDGAVFIVMELLDGVGVDELRLRQGGRLGLHSAIPIVEQLLEVLTAAHARNIIHRDIKPPNLFLTRDGSLKVLDFGIARIRDVARFDGSQWTGTGDLLGTPGFMAPEQALGQSDAVDAQTDVWAASATLFKLITGELVHCGRTPQELRVCAARDPARALESVASGVPQAIAAVVNRGLALDKQVRWSTAIEMRQALCAAYTAAFGMLPAPVTDRQWELPSEPEPAHPGIEPTSVVAPDSAVRADRTKKTGMERARTAPALVKKPTGKWTATPVLVAGILATTALGFMRFGSRPAPSLVISSPVASSLPDGRQPNAPQSADAADAATIGAPPPIVDGGASFKSRPGAVPPPKPSASLQECNPPTFLDDAGIKRPKPWCIL